MPRSFSRCGDCIEGSRLEGTLVTLVDASERMLVKKMFRCHFRFSSGTFAAGKTAKHSQLSLTLAYTKSFLHVLIIGRLSVESFKLTTCFSSLPGSLVG